MCGYSQYMCTLIYVLSFFFFFNDTATTEIYTLSLHDALPICPRRRGGTCRGSARRRFVRHGRSRSEEHTSELQSRSDIVCRLLLEKKKKCRRRRDPVPAAPLRLPPRPPSPSPPSLPTHDETTL